MLASGRRSNAPCSYKIEFVSVEYSSALEARTAAFGDNLVVMPGIPNKILEPPSRGMEDSGACTSCHTATPIPAANRIHRNAKTTVALCIYAVVYNTKSYVCHCHKRCCNRVAYYSRGQGGGISNGHIVRACCQCT